MTEPENKPTTQDEIAVTLTREQWQTVQRCIKFSADTYRLEMLNWQARSEKEKRYSPENAAMYERGLKACENIYAIIDSVVGIPFIFKAE